MSKKKSDSLLPAVPGLDLLPDQTTVDSSAAPKSGGGVSFLKLNKAGRYEVFNEDLGPEMLVVLGPHRYRACLWEGGQMTKESFDPKSEVYQTIKTSPKGKGDSTDGPCVGPEFLIWIVKKRQFVLYHAKNTAAKNAGEAIALKGKLVRMGSHKNVIQKRNITWYTPTYAASVETPDPSDLPTQEQFETAVKQFVEALQEPEGQPAGARPR